MSKNDLCEADKTLPDGNTDYNIDNCPGGYDVFRYISGKFIVKICCHIVTIKINRIMQMRY